MNILEILGSSSSGIVVGWLVSYFVRRYKDFNPTVLGTTVTLIFGEAVFTFLKGSSLGMWCYPIGLLIGFSLNIFLAYITGSAAEDIFYVEEEAEEFDARDDELYKVKGDEGLTLSKINEYEILAEEGLKDVYDNEPDGLWEQCLES